MDTKSKNKLGLVLASLLFLCLTSLSFLASADIASRIEYLQEDRYYKTSDFQQELDQFIDMVKTYHFNFRGYAEKTEAEKLGDQYEQLKSEFDNSSAEQMEQINQHYASLIEEAEASGKAENVPKLEQTRGQELQKIRQSQEASFRQALKQAVAEKDREYKDVEDGLAFRSESFHYYILNKNRDEVYANVPNPPSAEELKANSVFSVRIPSTDNETDSYLRWNNHFFQTNHWEGIVYIPKNVEGYSLIQSNAQYFSSIRERLLKECALLVISAAAAIGLFLYLRRHAAELSFVEGFLSLLRRIPIDLRALVLLFAVLCAVELAFSVSFFSLPIRPKQFVILGLESCAVAYLSFCLIEATRINRDHELWQQQWQKSLFVKYRDLLTDVLANRNMLVKFVLMVGLTLAFPVCALTLLYSLERRDLVLFLFSGTYCLFYVTAVLPYILRRISLMNKIFRGAEEMAAGNLDHQIIATGKGNLFRLADNLNNIKQGFKASVEGQVKSERLKSELITNVSHDLKTPLTSIVNYVNLLKEENLKPEEIASYIEVLDRKTQRLKVLIDDLFEASKMASGAVELQVENVNVASLLNQALAEFNDKIEESSLTFRVQVEHQQMFARLDGNKTWRVLENLIVNALKYSLPNTRVYVSLSEQNEEVILTMKNVSAYEIDFDAEELFERFKRGDKSRHTEGSGLGLAIAKSIVELQGGRLEIEIDGDYFKVTVAFPK
ncbi:sensor histidine kinase [Brevibacillus borstelensis]|uniref:sensor histidine kinase n=1 Tax=Brevibacillus borstelensis TaxID=45462 RepID=UPI0030C1C9A2